MMLASRWAEAVGPCFTRAAMARELGWTENQVDEATKSLDILAVTTSDDVALYPTFQTIDGHIVDGLGAVLRALSGGTRSAWVWATWLNVAVVDACGVRRPSNIERLRTGHCELVLASARRDAATWGM